MPAGFNKGQIEYIKTIANVNGHKTYKETSNISANNRQCAVGTAATCDPSLRYRCFVIGHRPFVNPTGSVDQTTNKVTDPTHEHMTGVYYVEINQNLETASPQQRVSPECFLESVNCKMRHVLKLDNAVDVQSHKEFRLLVFRHRERQSHEADHCENFSNPLYDILHGSANTKYGPKGFRHTMDHHGNIDYENWTGYNQYHDREALMTNPTNSEDYIVMKDCRYYLGREYGGKHIYEDKFFWDHEDPIAVDNAWLDLSDSNKNYCWYILILCTNNDVNEPAADGSFSGTDAAVDHLGYIKFDVNTYVTSG